MRASSGMWSPSEGSGTDGSLAGDRRRDAACLGRVDVSSRGGRRRLAASVGAEEVSRSISYTRAPRTKRSPSAAVWWARSLAISPPHIDHLCRLLALRSKRRNFSLQVGDAAV